MLNQYKIKQTQNKKSIKAKFIKSINYLFISALTNPRVIVLTICVTKYLKKITVDL